jgi:hypothetical protein
MTTTETRESVVEDFVVKLNSFMEQVTYLHNRVFELEKAMGYVLSKDAEWMAAFQKAQEQVAEQPTEEPSNGFEAPPVV